MSESEGTVRASSEEVVCLGGDEGDEDVEFVAEVKPEPRVKEEGVVFSGMRDREPSVLFPRPGGRASRELSVIPVPLQDVDMMTPAARENRPGPSRRRALPSGDVRITLTVNGVVKEQHRIITKFTAQVKRLIDEFKKL